MYGANLAYFCIIGGCCSNRSQLYALSSSNPCSARGCSAGDVSGEQCLYASCEVQCRLIVTTVCREVVGCRGCGNQCGGPRRGGVLASRWHRHLQVLGGPAHSPLHSSCSVGVKVVVPVYCCWGGGLASCQHRYLQVLGRPTPDTPPAPTPLVSVGVKVVGDYAYIFIAINGQLDFDSIALNATRCNTVTQQRFAVVEHCSACSVNGYLAMVLS